MTAMERMPVAAMAITTTRTGGNIGSTRPNGSIIKAIPARGSSLRQRQRHLQNQLQQPIQPHQEQDEDDDLILCSPRRRSDRRRNRNTPRPLDEKQQQSSLPEQQLQGQPRRPASSRSHSRYWHRQRARSRSPSSSKQPSFSEGPLQPLGEGYGSNRPSMSMTTEEFEALPPTVQRKYFSTLERLRFAKSIGSAGDIGAPLDHLHHPSTAQSVEDIRRPALKGRIASDPLGFTPHHRQQVYSSSARLYNTPTDKLYGRASDTGERHPPTSHSHTRSVILDATDEAFVKLGKRQSQLSRLDMDMSVPLSPLLPTPTMAPIVNHQAAGSSQMTSATDSILESLQWLEQDDDLDLRLCLDNDNMSQTDMRKQGRRPSLRRHLSISSKLSFGRPSESFSRPSTRSTLASPTLNNTFIGSLPGPNGHVRRRSRALSLINPNKAPMPSMSTIIDPAASHYQDPEARMKLRVYLASPHKFDEAIEFGFPSIDEVQDKENLPHMRSVSYQPSTGLPPLQTSIDDELESMSSGLLSPAEPSSPRTPESMDQYPLAKPMSTVQEISSPVRVDYAQAPASSREMTLRMTLTRPDLRANDEQIYGWQISQGRPSLHTRDGSMQQLSYTKGTNSKDSIERQFATFDRENALHERGVMKRFWNRVRRS